MMVYAFLKYIQSPCIHNYSNSTPSIFLFYFLFLNIHYTFFLFSSSSPKGPKSAALRTAITEELNIELSLLFYKINPDHWAGISDRIATALPQAAVSSYPYIKEVRNRPFHFPIERRMYLQDLCKQQFHCLGYERY